MVKKCIVCDKEFESNRNAQKCCSLECSKIRKKTTDRNKRSNKKLICKHCGSEFIGNENNKFCSKECKINNLKENKKIYNHICIVCGQTFKNRNKKGSFCSDKCKKNHRYLLTCKYCGKEFTSNNKKKKYCSNECYLSLTKNNREKCICRNCNKEFYKRSSGGDKNLFCSQACSGEYIKKNIKRYCTTCGSELKGNNRKYCSDECKKKAKVKKYVCNHCGESFESITKKLYCSKECQYMKNRFIHEVKECKYCGGKFETQFKKSKVFCSDDCRRKMANLRTKLHDSKRAELIKVNGKIDSDITLKKLFRKHNGVCAICGRKCDYNDYEIDENGNYVVGNEYPSIDHIIPVSKGGTHTWENVQLAHRLCNSYKCDGFIEKKNGQLSIF